MALYRLEAKIFSREKRGRSVVAASAYRAGIKLRDDIKDRIYDYSRRQKGVIETTILTPEGSPDWTHDSARLWNKVEHGEKRLDAQLARELVLAVPPEISDKEQFQLACQWAQRELVGKGMVVEISLHHPKSGTNPHVHLLCTMRALDGDHFSEKKPREWNQKQVLVSWRESWASAVNQALEDAGRDERVDHRSLKDQGIDRIPEPKIGVAATAMKRRGLVPDPDRFQLVRYIKSLNAVLPWTRALENSDEVHQEGMGKTWWERSLLTVSHAREKVRDTVMDTWAKFVNSRQPGGRDGPSRDHEPEHSR